MPLSAAQWMASAFWRPKGDPGSDDGPLKSHKPPMDAWEVLPSKTACMANALRRCDERSRVYVSDRGVSSGSPKIPECAAVRGCVLRCSASATARATAGANAGCGCKRKRTCGQCAGTARSMRKRPGRTADRAATSRPGSAGSAAQRACRAQKARAARARGQAGWSTCTWACCLGYSACASCSRLRVVHRERAQHLREAKLTANRVVKSHLDPAAREAQRAKDEEARAKRLAAAISKEVCPRPQSWLSHGLVLQGCMMAAQPVEACPGLARVRGICPDHLKHPQNEEACARRLAAAISKEVCARIRGCCQPDGLLGAPWCSACVCISCGQWLERARPQSAQSAWLAGTSTEACACPQSCTSLSRAGEAQPRPDPACSTVEVTTLDRTQSPPVPPAWPPAGTNALPCCMRGAGMAASPAAAQRKGALRPLGSFKNRRALCVPQVKRFWTKVERVVQYKEQQVVNAVKKKVRTLCCAHWACWLSLVPAGQRRQARHAARRAHGLSLVLAALCMPDGSRADKHP